MVLDWWFDLKFDKNQFPAENICSHQGHSQQVIDQKFIKSVVHDWANRDKKTKKILPEPQIITVIRADICVHLNRRVFNDHDAFRYATDSEWILNWFTQQANQTQPKTKILTSN